jgi:hypothetical protein
MRSDALNHRFHRPSGFDYSFVRQARSVLVSIVLIALVSTSLTAEGSPTEWISELGSATQPDETGNWISQRDAEMRVAQRIVALIQMSPGDATLTEARWQWGRTPLMHAALNGYADVVEALLADTSVRSSINAKDRSGATAWALVQLARPLTLGLCHPQMLTGSRAPLLRPYVARTSYFTQQAQSPFDRIRRALEAAGAIADIYAAKTAWRTLCPGQDAAMTARLNNSTDVLATVLHDNPAHIAKARQALDEQPRVQESPEPTLATPKKGTERLAPTNDKGMVCQRMPKLSAPGAVGWIGRAAVNLVAEVQAGRVVVAKLTTTPANIPLRAETLLRYRVLQTLNGYRCDGDHIFEQQFAFEIE